VPQKADLVLTAAQVRAAEQALIDSGTSVDELMQRAGRGAAEWVWRMAAGRSVTVLCGPGNNGGDGYVIAEALRERGASVGVIAATEPATDAARTARGLYRGKVLGADAALHALRQAQGDRVLVDCLFGTGLTRPLSHDHFALLTRLAASHHQRVAIDLPSGVESDSGAKLNEGLPNFDLTVVLGAWKRAHFLMPAAPMMGAVRLVPIGLPDTPGAARTIERPHLTAPETSAHKYSRGLLGVIGGEMPGAAVLAARAAQHAGAGYVKLLGPGGSVPPELVHDGRVLAESLSDPRFNALLVGPGLGRDGAAREALTLALAEQRPSVADADALMLLAPRMLAEHAAPLILTPHEGELKALERVFGCSGEPCKADRALALASAARAVVVAKGPDTVVAAPDGRLAFSSRTSSWLSTAGTGDVLAGTIASRLANGADAFEAACEGVWLHAEAAWLAGPAFTASELAGAIKAAYAACL
jgi:ADP-dependent NAD(P)H-hydrate dehydratase / NAD(P)H-hydrate epimerase